MSRLSHAPRGQISIFSGMLLMTLVLVILSLRFAESQWSDVNRLNGMFRAAAIAGAAQIDQASLVSSRGIASNVCLDATAARAEAITVLNDNLRANYGDSPGADVYTSQVMGPGVVQMTVYYPPSSPCAGTISPAYTYPTFCISAQVNVGLADSRGMAITHFFSACSQTAY